MDLKFEEIAEQFQSIIQRQQEADKDAKKLQSQLRHAAGGGGAAARDREGEGDGAEGEGDDSSEIVVEVPLWRRCFRLVSSREGQFIWYSVLLMFQMVSIFGLFVEASEDADGSTQSVAGILGASSVSGLLIAIPALYWRKALYLNVYLVCQIWTCAVAAVVTADAIQDVYKSYSFCMLKGVGGVPDEECPVRESRARGKVFYSLCTAFMAVTVGFVAQSIKDAIAREELEVLMRGRGGLRTLASMSANGTKKSMLTSRSLARIGAASQPSWKGKTWQSQKSIPTSKKLMQQLGEA